MEEYELQLLTVEQALLATQDENAREELKALKDNLIELIALTQVAQEQEENDRKTGHDGLEDEMQRFMNEIEEIGKDERKDDEAKLQELKGKFEKMIGEKCSAPHTHTWGAVAYHNAIICGIEDEAYIDEDGKLDVKLRILFTNPTHREMLPCNYYFDGKCRFDDDNCHYSHGETVPAAEIRDYAVPDFTKLTRNCVVLAKQNDRIWHRGRVLCANFIEKLCRVRLDNRENKEREKDFNFEDLLPIYHDEDLSSGSSSDSDSDSAYTATTSDVNMGFDNLFTYQLAQPLGSWEKHTRGIGSKLMAKMGYVYGTGLGSNGRGIITPVTAQILPQGRSLDHCMELREAANGDKDLFSVEKKLQRNQKKQENLNAKAYERESQKRVDVFSFINDTILSTPQCNGHSSSKPKPSLQSHSVKSLNVESVRVADDIRRKEREIAEVEKSLKRNASGSQIYDRLKQTLQTKKTELNNLQKEEKSLSKEQATRKTKEKLCVF